MLGIVTIVYNKLSLVKRSIEATLAMTKPPYIFVLVCNNPPYPGVEKYVKSLEGRVSHIIFNKKNQGVSKALFQGFSFCEKRGCKFLAKIDDDTVVLSRDWNTVMMKAFARFENLGILSADIDSGKQTGKSELSQDGNLVIEEFELPCVGGACTIYPVEMFYKIGFFKNFGYYGHEDGEFSVRARENNYRTAYLINTKCQHLGRTKESDPELDKWKLATHFGKTRKEFRDWLKWKEEKHAL